MAEIPTFLNTTNSNPNPGALEQINALVAKLVQLDAEIEEEEEVLSRLKDQHKLISEQHLPQLFEEAQITEITAANGKKIKLNEFYVGNVKNPAAMQWLEDNGFESLIDNTFTVQLKRGDEEDAKRVELQLTAMQVPFVHKEAIHHARLKSFINERMEQDPEFPQQIFNVTKISRVKTSK